jgi:hypothetical protein
MLLKLIKTLFKCKIVSVYYEDNRRFKIVPLAGVPLPLNFTASTVDPNLVRDHW